MSVLVEIILRCLIILRFHRLIQLHLNFVTKILLKFSLSFLLIHNKLDIIESN